MRARDFLTESQAWPETIDGYALARHAMEWHHTPEDFDEGDIYHNITSFGTYHLQRVPITELKLGRYTIHAALVADYASLPSEAPPVIVDLKHGLIIDGNHRAEAAVKRGAHDILAYVGDQSTYDPPYEEDDEWHPDLSEKLTTEDRADISAR